MIEKVVTIVNETGFHARPASLFVKEATEGKSEVFIISGDKEINAKSMIGLLSLGASKGTELTLRVDGEDEVELINKLADFIATMD